MFGVTPGLFKNHEAVALAAKAYTLEEKTTWIVMTKTSEAGIIYYIPVMTSDITIASQDGWELMDLSTEFDPKFNTQDLVPPRGERPFDSATPKQQEILDRRRYFRERGIV